VLKTIISILCFGLFMAGCASPPRVGQSTLLVQGIGRAESLNFVYRNVELKTVSSYSLRDSFGQVPSPADTGIKDFGSIVVGEARDVFAGRQVILQSAVLIDGTTPLPQEVSAPMLVLAPSSGKTQSTTMSTVASYVFSAQLLDPASRRLLWKGTIDSNAWVGKDFVMKNFEKTTYDAALARKLLQVLADKLAEEGLIR